MSGFRFESPYFLNLLFLIPVLIILAWYFQGQVERVLTKHFNAKYLPFLTASVSQQKRYFKLGLEVLALVFFIMALARPQLSDGTITVTNEGIELMILFDVSNSMLAEDMRPSRLQFAKLETRRFVDTSPGDRFGLVAFAGSAALVSPMTTDKNAIRLFIESLDTSSVSTQGTNFARGLSTARQAFERGSLHDEESAITRAIVLISDGEDHDGTYKDEVERLTRMGISIFTIAVGTPEGAAMPIREGGVVRGYRRDDNGQVIISRVSGETLKEIARQGGGSFYHMDYGGVAMNSLREDINNLQRSQFEDGEIRTYQDLFQIFLIFGFLLAIIELGLGERSKGGRLWKGRFEVMEK